MGNAEVKALFSHENAQREFLLQQIDAYMEKNPGMTEATFGHLSCRDTGLIPRLSLGGDVMTRKFYRILQFINTDQ